MPESAAVIGGGSLGCVIATWLHEAGTPVQMCARSTMPTLHIETTHGSREVGLPIAYDPTTVSVADVVFLTTKAQDTARTQPWLGHLVGADTVVVPVQNGVAHRDRLDGLVRPEQVLPAVAYISAERTRPGHVTHHSGTRLVVPDEPPAHRVQEMTERSQLSVEVTLDFVTASWRKLLTNVAGNSITTLTSGRMAVFDVPDVHDLAAGLMREAVAVGRAEGAELGQADIDEVFAMYARLPADNGSSMLYDRIAGRPLEHEYLTGAVISAGTRHRIDVPLTRAVHALLRGVDSTLRSGSPGHG